MIQVSITATICDESEEDAAGRNGSKGGDFLFRDFKREGFTQPTSGSQLGCLYI